MQARTPEVRLNVGGRRYETTRATLTRFDNTYFSSMLRQMDPADGAEMFIDRDGEAFGPLLNYMRTGTLSVPPSTTEAAVRAEADFYCLPLPEPRSGVRCDGLYLSYGSVDRE